MWAENFEALGLFLALQTQWRVVAGFGGVFYQGIDYAAAGSVMHARRSKDRGRLLEDLRVMEGAALAIMNKKRDG